MKEILVTTQAELDALPLKFDEFTITKDNDKEDLGLVTEVKN